MLITGKETARRLGVSYATFNYWKKHKPENLPPVVHFDGSPDRYDEKDIDELIKTKKEVRRETVIAE